MCGDSWINLKTCRKCFSLDFYCYYLHFSTTKHVSHIKMCISRYSCRILKIKCNTVKWQHVSSVSLQQETHDLESKPDRQCWELHGHFRSAKKKQVHVYGQIQSVCYFPYEHVNECWVQAAQYQPDFVDLLDVVCIVIHKWQSVPRWKISMFYLVIVCCSGWQLMLRHPKSSFLSAFYFNLKSLVPKWAKSGIMFYCVS